MQPWCWGTCWRSLVEILKLRFGKDFEPEFRSRFWSWRLFKILNLRFSWNFEADVWPRFWSWSLVEILKPKSICFDEDTQPFSLLCLWQIYNIPPFLDHDCNLEPTKNHVSRHRSGHGGATAGESSKVKTTTFSENSSAPATNAILRYKVCIWSISFFLSVSCIG